MYSSSVSFLPGTWGALTHSLFRYDPQVPETQEWQQQRQQQRPLGTQCSQMELDGVPPPRRPSSAPSAAFRGPAAPGGGGRDGKGAEDPPPELTSVALMGTVVWANCAKGEVRSLDFELEGPLYRFKVSADGLSHCPYPLDDISIPLEVPMYAVVPITKVPNPPRLGHIDARRGGSPDDGSRGQYRFK